MMSSDVDSCVWSSVPAEYVLILCHLFITTVTIKVLVQQRTVVVFVLGICAGSLFFLLCCVLALFLGARY